MSILFAVTLCIKIKLEFLIMYMAASGKNDGLV